MGTARNANRRRTPYQCPAIDQLLTDANNFMSKMMLATDGTSLEGENLPLFDGYLVNTKLQEFCTAVRKITPDIKFVMRDAHYWSSVRCKDGITRNVRTAGSVAGYFAGDPYASVELIIDADDKYRVGSRTINNNRYKCNYAEFYHAFSDTLPSAIKAFRKNFRRITPQEIAKLEYGTVAVAASQYNRDLVLAQAEAKAMLYESTSFVPYMRALAAGDTPPEDLTKTMRALAIHYIKSVDTRAEAMQSGSRLLYIQIDPSDRPTYSVVSCASSEAISPTAVVVNSTDELEEKFPGALGRVAALAMTDKETFVNGVGMRTHDNVFWVVQ